MQDIVIRPEKPVEYHAMEQLVRDAFWDRYSPGCCEHYLVHVLRNSSAVRRELCFAAEQDGVLAGGIWYAEAMLRTAAGNVPVLTLGPVAVSPAAQRRGIGSALIRHTLELAGKTPYSAVLLYGDAGYYSRFGFRPASDVHITDSAGNACPAIQVYSWKDLPAGAFDEGDVYQLSQEKIRDFDRLFPHRQKHLNPRQLFFVPPSPSPEEPLLRQSWELRRRACGVLRSSGILEAWESLGAKVRAVGSFRSNLMAVDRDVDLHIYTETLDVKATLHALSSLLAGQNVCRLTYVNGADTDEHCLEWHLVLKDEQGEEWSVDMIQIPAGSPLDGFFEDTAERVDECATPELRRAILSLKCADPKTENIRGIEFCRAVMEGGVRNWEEFVRWRQGNPASAMYSWRP